MSNILSAGTVVTGVVNTGVTANGRINTTISPGNLTGGFSFTKPKPTITLSGENGENAELDAALINQLKLLLEVINELPDEHPLGNLKHDMQMRKAFNRLGG